MKATGIINTAACRPGQPGLFGAEVAPGLVGHIHQHIFCARLDMEVDGPNNTVVECDTAALPLGRKIPMATLMQFRSGSCERAAAQRNVDFDKMRYWKIINPERRIGSAGRRATSSKRVRRCVRSFIPTAHRGGALASSSISSG